MQKKLALAGYQKVREPFDISDLKMEDVVIDIEIIAPKRRLQHIIHGGQIQLEGYIFRSGKEERISVFGDYAL